MAKDDFKFSKSKEDLKEMKDLLKDIKTDLQKNKDEVLEWTNAEKNLNKELEKIVDGMEKSKISTQRTVTAIQAARNGTLSVYDAGKMLEKQNEELAAEKAKLANWEYGHLSRVNNLQKALDEEAKNGLTDKFYKIQKNLAAEKQSMIDQEAKIDALAQEGDILDMLQGKMKGVEASKEQQNNLQDIDNKLLGGAYAKYKEIAKQSKTTWGMAAIGLTAVVGLIMAVASHTDQIGEKFGAIGVNEFQGDLMSATATAQSLGYDFDEMSSSVSELSNNFGVAFGDAIKMSKASMDTARALGISTDQAAQLTGHLITIGGHSAETAQDFLKQTAALAKSAGVAPAAVMADIAGSSEDVAVYTKDSGENIAHAAIKAKSLGMSLGDVAKVADGLLDFQSSLGAEMEASVLIGRQLNLQKARELALTGDLSGMMDSVLDQLGSEEEFNKLNVIQRKALASSLGVGVDQMAKMVKHAGKSNLELARMGENIDISNIASADALSAISEMRLMFKGWATSILSVIAGFAQIGNGAGLIIPALVILGGWVSFIALKGVIAGWSMKLMGKGGEIGAKGVGKFGTQSIKLVPVLLSFAASAAAVGLAAFGIGFALKQLPPIFNSIASGFKIVAEVVTSSLLQLASKETVLGIMGLAGAFWMLAGALASVALAGIAAIPAMAAVTGFTTAMTVLGMAGESTQNTQQDKTELDGVKTAIESVASKMDTLIENFNTKYIPAVVMSNVEGGKRTGKEVKKSLQEFGF